MKMLNNINLSTIDAANTGLDSAIIFTARDKRVMSAIYHGLNAVAAGFKAAGCACATAGCVGLAADKSEDMASRVTGGVAAALCGVGTYAYGREAVGEAKKAYADVQEVMKG